MIRFNERYSRQIKLKGFGEEAQQKLLNASVLVIGAGGLGCPALQYLVSAGVGTIGIVDDDVVALSNLHRQVLYSTSDIGLAKVTCAAEKLKSLNPDCKIIPHLVRLTTANALSIIRDYAILLDGSDNFATRYLVNDACVLLGKPFIHGAISQYEGQVAVFNAEAENRSANYRDLFPQPPEESVLNCEEMGVLGVLSGVIGAMMAGETIKLITGIGKALINRLLIYNLLNNQYNELKIMPRKENRSPSTESEFQQMQYEWMCSTDAKGIEVEVDFLNQAIAAKDTLIIDVREVGERPQADGFSHICIPFSEIQNRLSDFKSDQIILFCQSGKRSLKAAQYLSSQFASKKIYSLRGGIGCLVFSTAKNGVVGENTNNGENDKKIT